MAVLVILLMNVTIIAVFVFLAFLGNTMLVRWLVVLAWLLVKLLLLTAPVVVTYLLLVTLMLKVVQVAVVPIVVIATSLLTSSATIRRSSPHRMTSLWSHHPTSACMLSLRSAVTISLSLAPLAALYIMRTTVGWMLRDT